MEIISPLSFLYGFFSSPLSGHGSGPHYTTPQLILAACYLIHYANRAVISPFRTPSRSRSNLIVPLTGIFFNIPNGALNGAYITSPSASRYLSPDQAFGRPTFYLGLALWAVGFVGNMVHDEILINIRKKASVKGKDKDSNSNSKTGQKQHYAIPYGLLFKYVSFPNYFCEWVEWFGFALAAAPFPVTSSMLSQILTPQNVIRALSIQGIRAFVRAPVHEFWPLLQPPYIFLLNELLLMFPRAYKGHLWYHEKFGESYPKERKIAIPFLL
jgi:3-oxo-5-alpha-steroid 4-dehydrogenase 1